MNGQGWLRSRHVAEVPQAFFWPKLLVNSLHHAQWPILSVTASLRVQVGRAAKVQHPIVTNSRNDFS